jgi:hypothetical protein
MPAILHLNLHREFFSQIAAGATLFPKKPSNKPRRRVSYAQNMTPSEKINPLAFAKQL